MLAGTNVKRHAGGWVPHEEALDEWLGTFKAFTESHAPSSAYHPSVAGLHELLERDPILWMYVTEMIAQVPKTKRHRLRDVPEMLRLIDAVIGTAPRFDESVMVGCPLNALLDWTMGTPAGYAAFRNPSLNTALGEILRAWCDFLSSRDSLYVLNSGPHGWTSAAAARAVEIDQFVHDPDDGHWGFGSWNDFFTRRFRPGERPVSEPDDDKVIVSACEATPYALSTEAKARDRFWLKSQPYSVHDMLGDDDAAAELAGGTVYQSFLTVVNYHRWHSPVRGVVRKAFVLGGTYFSEAKVRGGRDNSIGYMTAVATRAIVEIDCHDPAVGLVALVFVGMGEVSSCRILDHVTPGLEVGKGEELGYFQYGGSTYCMIFGPGVIASFETAALPRPHDPDPPPVLLSTKIATTR